MEGVKVQYINPETGDPIAHWDEAKNIAYDNANTNLASTTIQDAISELASSASATLIARINNTAEVSQDILPGVFYKFTNPVTKLTLSPVQPNGNILDSYCGKFVAGSGCVVSFLPSNTFTISSIVFEEGKTYEFYIVDNVVTFSLIDASGTKASNTVSLVAMVLNRGDVAAAITLSTVNKDVVFQYLLELDDSQGNTLKKMLWHIGNGTYIDALGSEIISNYQYNG